MAETIYSADQIIGKALFAKVPVKLKRIATDNAPSVYTVPAGTKVGDVYSYLNIKPGERKNLYWAFYDSKKKPYFVEHMKGAFDINTLKEQGALTVKETAEAEAKKSEGIKEFIERMVKYIIGGIVIYGVGSALISRSKK